MGTFSERFNNPLCALDPEMARLDESERQRAILAELLGTVSTRPEVHTFDPYDADHQATVIPLPRRDTPKQTPSPYDYEQESSDFTPDARAIRQS